MAIRDIRAIKKDWTPQWYLYRRERVRAVGGRWSCDRFQDYRQGSKYEEVELQREDGTKFWERAATFRRSAKEVE